MNIFQKIQNNRFILSLLLISVLVLVVFSVFHKTTEYKAINTDDRRLAIELFPFYNSADKTTEKLKTIFTKPVFFDATQAYYRPVLNLSFFVDSVLSGGEVNFSVNHLTNVLLHIICVVILFYFLSKYFFNLCQSFLICLIFALSPFSLHSVAWISGRNDLLLGIFSFAAFIFFIKYNENEKHKALVAFIHALFLFLSFLTKETAIVLIPTLVGYAFIKKYKYDYKIVVLWIAVIAAFLILRRNCGIIGSPFVYVLVPYVLKGNLYMFPDFFANAFLLAHDYIYPKMEISVIIKGMLAATALFLLSLRSSNRKEALLFLGLSVIWLTPAFCVYRLTFQGNRFYIPEAFILMCIFYIVVPFLTNYKKKALFYLIVFIFMILSVIRINNRINVFYDDIVFFKQAILESDCVQARYEYGDALLKRGRYEESAQELEKSVKSGMISQKIIGNLAIANIHSGNYEEAGQILEKYENLFPKDKDYYEFVLMCYEKTDKTDKVKEYRERIIIYEQQNNQKN